ncbi:MAG: N-acetylmuramoyl-L-alanine amidase, partial [Chloroflexota bacterium]|nr:N-acetylmuramoyl-L-alanine amidase [Chloroflexota bacterium]
MSKILALVVALSLALAVLPAHAAGSDSRESKTVASEWKETVAARRGVVTRSTHLKRQGQPHSASRASESTTYTSKVHNPEQAFTAVGPNWKTEVPSGAAVEVSVRTSADGKTWTVWRLTEESHGDEGRDRDGRTFGSLVVGDLSRFAQYRVTTFPSPNDQWPRVSDVTLTYINATAGPSAQEAQASTSGQYQSFGVSKPAVISRAGWGADEKYRFNSSGKEIWDREYLPITKAVLHDTVTRNNDPNPAATVRSIYYYHAVTRGWGDIGYNYLIDEQGRIYEGRYGGQNVVGGHALCYNFGTLGISALGWHGPAYGGTPDGVRPSEAMVSAFKRLIAWHFDRAGIDPLGRGIFMKRNIEPKADLPNILAHHDT